MHNLRTFLRRTRWNSDPSVLAPDTSVRPLFFDVDKLIRLRSARVVRCEI